MVSTVSLRTGMAPGTWHGLVQAWPMCCTLFPFLTKLPNRQSTMRTPIMLTFTHSKTTIFLLWLFQVILFWGQSNGKKVQKEVGIPEVYLFIYSLPAICQLCDLFAELAQIQVIKWILLWSLGVDLLGPLQFCCHGGQQWFLQVQVIFNFLS